MSEIERAIECFKKKVWSGELYESEVDMYNAVIKVLRAELEREKNPLTCDGCEWKPKMMGITRCNKCKRFPLLTDRYEPKGEKE